MDSITLTMTELQVFVTLILLLMYAVSISFCKGWGGERFKNHVWSCMFPTIVGYYILSYFVTSSDVTIALMTIMTVYMYGDFIVTRYNTRNWRTE